MGGLTGDFVGGGWTRVFVGGLTGALVGGTTAALVGALVVFWTAFRSN